MLPFALFKNISPSPEATSNDMGADADIDRAIAAGTVPPFITAEFLKENRITSTTVSIVLMVALACAVVACRLLSRKFVAKRFGLGLDDGMAVLSLVSHSPR